MAMTTGDVIAEGILGAFMGAGKGAAENAREEQKNEAERIKEDRLSKLRMGEYTQKQAMDVAAAATERARLGSAAQAVETKVAGMDAPQPGEEVDAEGNTLGIIEGRRQLTAREQAAARLHEAQASGDKDLVAQYEKQHKDLTDEERNNRQDKREDLRAKNDSERNAIAAAESARREAADRMRDAQQQKHNDILLASILGKDKKADLGERKFSDKQWSDAKKDLTGNMFVTDEMGKDTPDHVARAAASSAMRTIQSSGTPVDPVDAANVVGSVISRVSAAARAEAKGDVAKYQKYLAAGVDYEINKALNGKPAPKEEPKPSVASAPKSAPIQAVQSNGDEYLRKASVAQLWAAVDDPKTKALAVAELRRRGLLADESTAPDRTDRFNPS